MVKLDDSHITEADNDQENTNYLEFEKPLADLHQQINDLKDLQKSKGINYSPEIRQLRSNLVKLTTKIYNHLTAWETVQVARHPQRPLSPDYLDYIVKDFLPLHGDRMYGDDKAMLTGFGRIGREKVMVVALNKGRNTTEKIACNFGCAHPEGYRKALLKMKMAEKYNLPIVCLIDTPGAYPGIAAEERGQAQAIAVNLMEMSKLRVPIVCTVIGEGGSGGALGIGVGDKLAMLQYAYYSVISPEGCAAILWKDGAEAPKAAEALKLTSKDLLKLKIIDDIIQEPLGGAHRNHHEAAHNLEAYILKSLRELKRFKIDNLLENRYKKLMNMGDFTTTPAAKVESSIKVIRPSETTIQEIHNKPAQTRKTVKA